jgi:hypothetical protein
MVFRNFWVDDGGFILSTEALLLGTLVALGMIVGLAEVRNAVVQELGDYSQAVAWLSQDFEWTSVESTNVAGDIQTSGSIFSDSTDVQEVSTIAANGILVDSAAVDDDE